MPKARSIATGFLWLSMLFSVRFNYKYGQDPEVTSSNNAYYEGLNHFFSFNSSMLATTVESLGVQGGCTFRHYPSHRFYGLQHSHTMSFLNNTEYIRGQFPILLPSSAKFKFCVNQSEWVREGMNSYADGTNPTLLSLNRLKSHLKPDHPLLELMQRTGSDFLASICFKACMACHYNGSRRLGRPDTSRAVLLLLNNRMETLGQATVLLERDADLKGIRKKMDGNTGRFKRSIEWLDDIRLFAHDGQVWIGFKNFDHGMSNLQFFSPLHFETAGISWEVSIRSSELRYACCGRNMGVLEQPIHNRNKTSSNSGRNFEYLFLVDPVMVSSDLIGTADIPAEPYRLRGPAIPEGRSSDMHGTSGFLLHLSESNEYLGVAHAHRSPENEEQFGEFAPFGHHYTHAFFTLSDQPPYKLKRLSNEFIFASSTPGFANDGENIQFASGLELIKRDGKEYVLLGYGVADCEALGTLVSMGVLNQMLLPVKDGEEVVHVMKKPPALKSHTDQRYN